MRLGAADVGREARPSGADTGKMQTGRVDEPDHVAQLAPGPARRHAQHVLEQPGKHQGTAAAIGIRKGGAPRDLSTDVIEPRLMAGHRDFDLAQRTGAGQLAVEKRDELVTGLELAHQIIAAVFLYEPFERAPRNQFQHMVQDAILMPHGVDPSFVSRRFATFWNREESMPCAFSSTKRAGQPWDKPGHDGGYSGGSVTPVWLVMRP